MRHLRTALLTLMAVACSQLALAATPGFELTPITPLETSVDTPSSVLSGNLSALNLARVAAVSDSVTTYIAISAGAVESNGLVTPTPAGLLGLAVVKLGILQYADSLSKNNRKMMLKVTSALWGGASANNLLVAVSGVGIVPLIIGVAAGYWMWVREDKILENEELEMDNVALRGMVTSSKSLMHPE